MPRRGEPRGAALLVVVLGALCLGVFGPAPRWEAAEPATAEAAFLAGQQALAAAADLTLSADLTRAEDLFRLALESYRGEGAIPGQAASLYALGWTLSRSGRLEEAWASYEEARKLYEDLKDPLGLGRTLNNLGLVLVELGRISEGLSSLEASLELRRRVGQNGGGNVLEEAESLHNLGAVHLGLGETQTALERLRGAAAIYRDSGSPPALARTLSNLALLQAESGVGDRALALFREALELHRRHGDRRGEAATRNNLGLVHLEQKNLALAGEAFRAALEVFREVADLRGEGAALSNLGLVALAGGEPAKAEEQLGRALALRREARDEIGEGETLGHLGRTLLERGRGAEGARRLEEALATQERLGDDRGAGWTLYWLATEARERGDLAVAVGLVEGSIERIESLRSRVQEESLRAHFLAPRREIYDLHVRILLALARRATESPETEGKVRFYRAAALEASEQARARSLRDALREALGASRDLDPELLERQRSLRRRIAGLHRARRIAAEGALASFGEPSPGASSLDGALDEYRQLSVEIRRNSVGGEVESARGTRRDPEGFLTLLQGELDSETVLLEYHLGEEESTLWVVSRSGIEVFSLAPSEVLEEAADGLHEAMRRSDRRAFRAPARIAAADLAEKVLAPAFSAQTLSGGALARARRLVVIPDGALHLVPFAALPLPGAGISTPLVERYEVVSLPSSALLPLLRRRRAEEPKATAVVAVFADPDFGGPDTSPSLPRLPFSRREAESILRRVPPDRALAALGIEAMRERVIGGELEPYRILHFATHGLLDDRRPELSGLMLSRVDGTGRPREGFVSLLDISGLRLRAELVVLSACRTALGRPIRGEGLVGLTRGFFQAGSPRLLASLWDVSDEATAELMERFYGFLLEDGEPPAAALRAAQRSLRAEPRWSAPAHWAGFVLQGDWR